MSERDVREIEKHLKNLTSGLVERIVRSLENFTVALLGVTNHHSGERLELAGTGTLLVREGRHFILTARHVWECILKDAERIALTLKAEMVHKFSIDRRDVAAFGPPAPDKWNEWGPDIVLLSVPAESVGTIQAYKVFLNADNNLEIRRPVMQIEVLMGTPAVLGTILDGHADLQMTGMFRHGQEAEHSRGNFDYHDFDVDLSLPGPRTFGGVSGGGFWQVYLYWADSEIEWKTSLHGVAFYELPIVNEHRIVRCHGSRSIREAIGCIDPDAQQSS
jgi:hypothetical protein